MSLTLPIGYTEFVDILPLLYLFPSVGSIPLTLHIVRLEYELAPTVVYLHLIATDVLAHTEEVFIDTICIGGETVGYVEREVGLYLHRVRYGIHASESGLHNELHGVAASVGIGM